MAPHQEAGPLPGRLEVRAAFALLFDVPGLQGERLLPVTVNEYHNGIGFSYSLMEENDAYLRRRVPLAAIKRLASMVGHIISDLEMAPRRLAVRIGDPSGAGGCGQPAMAIVGRDTSVCLQMELFEYSLSKKDSPTWEGLLYRELMVARYVLERRWPSMWPFYAPEDLPTPYRLLDPAVHLATDGWIVRHKKPNASSKAARLSEFMGCARDAGLTGSESALTAIAEGLWAGEADIWKVAEILCQLGLPLDDTTPLGRWLRKHPESSP
jgi:hypothetical protein